MITEEKHLSPKAKRRYAIASATVLILFTAVLCHRIGVPMIRFVSEPERFRAWVDEGGISARLAFLGMVIFQVIIAVIPGEPLEIGAGYAFGAVEGTLLCLIGTTLGGISVFLLVRKWGIRFAEIFFPLDKIRSLRVLHDPKKRDLLTFFLFFLPGTPKDLLCYFVGLTDMKLSVWIAISAVARIPSIVTSTVGGSALGEKKYVAAIAVFAATLAVSGVGLLIYRRILKPRKSSETSADGES